jgi:DNA-binding phage protein
MELLFDVLGDIARSEGMAQLARGKLTEWV